MLFLCLGFVLFEWLSALYDVFPACNISSQLYIGVDLLFCSILHSWLLSRLQLVVTLPYLIARRQVEVVLHDVQY